MTSHIRIKGNRKSKCEALNYEDGIDMRKIKSVTKDVIFRCPIKYNLLLPTVKSRTKYKSKIGAITVAIVTKENQVQEEML